MPYERPRSLSTPYQRSSTPKFTYLSKFCDEQINNRKQLEELSIPPSLQRFITAPNSRPPSSPQLSYANIGTFQKYLHMVSAHLSSENATNPN
ncbi:unnamed protein product [Thelazia callipaeda]|uniref:Uncharacterized protein n=1 Tax=Thelazia callipaeda TaxID=103827 RepID=A0A0N5CXP2_THECL|nr:unnamed protein product [Thelazia callipaeda]